MVEGRPFTLHPSSLITHPSSLDRHGRTVPVPGSVPVTLFNSASSRGWRDREEIAAFVTAGEIFLLPNHPDLLDLWWRRGLAATAPDRAAVGHSAPFRVA